VSNVTGGRRERKKQATSVALHEAALRLFAENGYAETTVEEIAEAADVAARTFFRHFGSKEAVLFADEEPRRELWRAALHERPANEPILVTMREAALALADDYSTEKDFFRWELASKSRSIQAYWLQVGIGWESVHAEEVASRLALSSRYDVTARTVAAAALGAWRVAEANWVRDRGKSSLRTHLLESYGCLEELASLAPAPVTAITYDGSGEVIDVREVATDRTTKVRGRVND
jgi:TetR/AcrR family transcriptional regulator, regulator of mycofactocin system